jgi:hypothetical protein
MKHSIWMIVASVFLLTAGCSSSGTFGIVTKSTADPVALLKSGRPYQELGSVEGQACRHFVLAVVPWGEGDVAHAVDKALEQRGGDAMVNVSVETSLYGFVPIYNVYSFTCTTVKGIAVKFLDRHADSRP